MLYETLYQPTTILWLFSSGLLTGLFLDFATLFFIFIKKNQFFINFLAFFKTFFIFFIFFIINLKINFGQIRFFAILIYILALFFQKYISKKIIAFYNKKCYNLNNENKQKSKTKQK